MPSVETDTWGSLQGHSGISNLNPLQAIVEACLVNQQVFLFVWASLSWVSVT